MDNAMEFFSAPVANTRGGGSLHFTDTELSWRQTDRGAAEKEPSLFLFLFFFLALPPATAATFFCNVAS